MVNKFLVVFMEFDEFLEVDGFMEFMDIWVLVFGSYEVVIEIFNYELLLLEFLDFYIV